MKRPVWTGKKADSVLDKSLRPGLVCVVSAANSQIVGPEPSAKHRNVDHGTLYSFTGILGE